MTPKVAVKITFDRYFDKMVTSGGGGKTSLGAATRIRQEIRCLLYGGFFTYFLMFVQDRPFTKNYIFEI